jgi:hypothetical protein
MYMYLIDLILTDVMPDNDHTCASSTVVWPGLHFVAVGLCWSPASLAPMQEHISIPHRPSHLPFRWSGVENDGFRVNGRWWHI